jgi:hypothetical protein
VVVKRTVFVTVERRDNVREVSVSIFLRTGLCLLGLLFDPEDGGSVFLRIVCELMSEYMASHLKILYSS